MSNRINLNVIMDKTHFQKGENISGTVHLELLEPFKVKKITLFFNKSFECEFNEDSTVRNTKFNNYIYEIEIILYQGKKNLNELGSGHHRFPFSITPRKSDSGTSHFSDFIQDSYLKFRNTYLIKACLDIQNEEVPKLSTSKIVSVIPKNEIIKKMTEKINIMSCICLSSRNILLIAYADQEKYLPSDTIKFISRLSTSDYHIKRMKTRLICNILINCRNLKIKRTKSLNVNNNSKNIDSECLTELDIPMNAPFSTDEKYLKVSYILESLIYINRGSPIMIQRNIIIEQKEGPNEKYAGIGAIKGIVFPIKNYSLD